MTERVRVLWLIKGLGPGGAERLLASAAEVRDRQTFEYEAAYLLPWKRHLAEDLETAGVAVHCLGGSHALDLRWVVRLRRLLAERGYDVVHVHSPMVAGVARLLVRSLPRRLRPRLVTTEHNNWSSYAPPTRLLNALTFPLGDIGFAVSTDVRESIPPRLRSGVEVLVHGLLVERAAAQVTDRQVARAQLGLTDGDVVVGTVANLRAQKAYPDLLAAARMILDKGLPVTFVAVGQGPLEDEIHALHARLGLGDGFRLLGYRQDPVRVLTACDVFALASLYEGLPVALMEALAVGLPVVATAVGGIPEAVRDGVEGLLVPPGQPGRLAAAIETLVGDPQRRARMARAAAARAHAFDIRTAVNRLETEYLQLAGAAREPVVVS
ncbi:MAG: glycosyltransferase [Actinomycetota bacterium]|nr:glycosyltransferase [Actinomycetota bacterium]